MQFSLTPFEQLRPGIWRAVAQPAGVNIGLIVGSAGALVVDTGSAPAQGAEIRAAAEAVAGVPLLGAVVTHGHFDHYYGLAAFDDLTTHGHETLVAALDADQVATEAAGLGFDVELLKPPNRPMALARMINLGDRYVELVHFGRGHTAGDVVVIVPDAQLIFTGDLLEQAAPPAMGADCHLKEWPAALDGVLGLVSEDTVLVPGHGEPVDRVFAFTQRAEISAVYGQVEHLIGQGVKLEDALTAGDWPYDDETITAVLPIAYAQLAAEGKVPRTQLRLLK
ncbi:MBL fold metallo-hydrolase [Micropruina sp.]|uniref:MBL fold metallo-hydrolase n=1 Tax=Micropruina sp. TaxID=2737536 RepID=UPI0026274D9D|nr:MBL fold metallo-hydrolase [Micropruina sp.]